MNAQLIERFIQKAFKYPQEDQEKILAAATFADSKHDGQKRASGEPYIIHPWRSAKSSSN